MCACVFCTFFTSGVSGAFDAFDVKNVFNVFNVFVHSVQTLYGRGAACASRNTLSLLVVPSGC